MRDLRAGIPVFLDMLPGSADRDAAAASRPKPRLAGSPDGSGMVVGHSCLLQELADAMLHDTERFYYL